MQTTFTIQEATAAQMPAVITLLQNNKLPVEDIAAGRQQFWIATINETIAGIIAVEKYGTYALLRSMATDTAFRNNGIATQLVQTVFNFAQLKNISAVYLLTETAEQYFAKKGFTKIDRQHVPEAIQQSTEFASVCPSSAIVMENKI
jgi:amino-acid N-acetyltransferase